MQSRQKEFDELVFFALLKRKPGMFLGQPSLLSLRDHLFGMVYAFSFSTDSAPMQYFQLFIDWYHSEIIQDSSGYACWWNHLLYTSGNHEARAFDSFFAYFERYLRDVHGLSLPEIE